MSHPFLPKRKTGTENRFPLPAEPGVWEERPNTHLEHLGDAIEIPPSQSRIYSIPDPWARAILFDRALFDEKHKLHLPVLGEWRGMLALLGLKERRNYELLSVREVDLNRDGGAGTFTSVLAQLMPADDNLLSPSTTWENFYVFRWSTAQSPRPAPFAFTSPMTLLATGADYAGVLSPQQVPWFDGSVLTDPVPHLSERERRALAEWIQYIIDQVTGIRTHSSRGTRLADRLRHFVNSLDPSVQTVNPKDILSEMELGLTYDLYRCLNHPRKKETGALTDVEIVSRKRDRPKYLLIEPSLAQQWNQIAREIVVYQDVSLATSDAYTRSGKTSDAITRDIHWCTPAFFFSDRLIYEANGTEAFPGCEPVKFTGDPRKRSVILPLTPDVLKVFTPEELTKNFTIHWQPDGSAVCQLVLQLRASNGEERTCKITRAYTANDMVKIDNLPIICLWPNFRLANWKTYFLFQVWSGGAKQELKVKPWSAEELEPASHREHNVEGRQFQIYRNEKHPQALVCTTPYFNEARHRESVGTGLLLLKQPSEDRPSIVSSLVLGIDFGSTGTNIYQSQEEASPQPVVLKNRIVRITDSDPAVFRDFNRDYFLPARDWSAENILSIFHDFGDPAEGDTGRAVIRDGHVLFIDDPMKFTPSPGVRSNLKWGGERDAVAAKDFLMQLCLQAAAELAVQGAREADVRFSYPTAFSNRDLHRFETYWHTVAEKVSQITGLSLRLDLDTENREAVAATRFFSESTGLRKAMDLSQGALTVDIGGGTTDLAMWDDRSLRSHSSIVFAGRDIFLAPLRRKPEVLKVIEPRVNLDRTPRNQQVSSFNAQLDAVVASHGDSLIEALQLRHSHPMVEGFLSLLQSGLCGIAFYSGLLVRRLREEGTFTPGRRIALFIGGNGSKMFQWCAYGRFSERAPIYEQTVKAFLTGADLKETRVTLQLSDRPKAEVAYGLVRPGIHTDIGSDFGKRVAGEKWLLGKEERNWNDAPNGAQLRDRAIKVSVDRTLPKLTEFLNAMELFVDEDQIDDIAGHVNNRFAQQAQEIDAALEKDRRLRMDDMLRGEPIFIIALKRYLEMETERWARGE